MLNINKNEVDFLVTENMVTEVEKIIEKDFPKIDKIIRELKGENIKNIYFVACGSPLSACKTAEFVAHKYSNLLIESYTGLDFIAHPPYKLDEKSLVIGVSDSGNTAEVVDAMLLAKAKGAFTLAFTKDEEGNKLSEAIENLIAYKADCIWEVHLLLTYYLIIEFILKTGVKSNEIELKKIIEDFKKLPEILQKLVNETEEKAKKIGEQASNWPFIYTVAAGPLLPLGYKEGIITMLEFTWSHGSFLNAAGFAHGPLEVVEAGVPYVFILGNDESREITNRALNFVKEMTDNYLVFDVKDYEDSLHPMLSPFILFVPLEYFYYYLSLNKDHNPDNRRYYGGLRPY